MPHSCARSISSKAVRLQAPEGFIAVNMDNGPRRSSRWISDELWERVFEHINSPVDRALVSEVCKQWKLVDSLTRKHVTVGFPYAVKPSHLTTRFRNLEGLKIKGKPRVSEFGLVVKNWGGYAGPWIFELVAARRTMGDYACLSSLHFRRMEVSDVDLATLAEGFSNSLEELKLDKCTGFSTAGLLAITRSCRLLRVLYLEESIIEDAGSDWLHELALHHSRLEVLNFFLTGLEVADITDLAAIVSNCKSLRSLKLGEIGVVNMRGILSPSNSLKELAVVYGANDHTNINDQFDLPKTLTSFAGDIPLPLDLSGASSLMELDLMSTYTTLNAEAHDEVIKCCPNLEVLKVRNIIGDVGLAALASHCKKLRSIRIENLEDHHGFVSHRGLISLASSCVNLQFVAIYVSDIANSALRAFGEFCPNLVDFRIVLLESSLPVTELPLDSGVKSLLEGCKKITRLAVYLRHGGLTDKGLADVGKLGGKLKWLLLGCVGNSNQGFLDLASGCHSLLKLELRDCPFTETGIAAGVRRMQSLKFLWVQGYQTQDPYDLLDMGEWIVEYIPGTDENPCTSSQIVAYRSLTGPRSDCPPQVIPLSKIARFQ